MVLIDRHNTAAHGEFKYISFPRAVFFIYNEIYWNLFAKSGKIEDYLIYRREQNSVGCSAERAKAMGVNVKGLILKEQNIGENDKLVTVLTDSLGVLRAFVRGAKKLSSKKQSATGLLCYSKLSLYKTKDSYIIEEAESIESFFGLRNDIEKLSLAQYFCDIAFELSPKEDDATDFLRVVLNSLYFWQAEKDLRFC